MFKNAELFTISNTIVNNSPKTLSEQYDSQSSISTVEYEQVDSQSSISTISAVDSSI